MKKIRLNILLIILINHFCCLSQKDSVYFSKLANTFKFHLKGNIDSANLYAKRLLNESINSNYKKGEGLGNNYIGICYIYSGNYDSAIVYLKKALVIYNPNTLSKWVCDVYSNLGVCYDYLGNYAEATKNYLKAFSIADKIKDDEAISRTSNNIGTIYFQQHNYNTALNYFQTSLSYRELKKDDYGIASCCLNIASCLQSMKKIEKSNYFLNKSIRFSKLCGDSLLLADGLTSLGQNYCKAKDYQFALNLYNQALAIYLPLKDPRPLSELYSDIAKCVDYLGNHSQSHHYFLKALNYAKSAEYIAGEMNAISGLIITSAYLKMPDSTGYYLGLYQVYKDSIYSESNSKQIANMQALYQTEKKDSELKLKDLEISKQTVLNKQKSFQLNVFIIAILILIVIIIFVYVNYKQKVKANIEISNQKEIITKQKLLVDEKQKEVMDSIKYAGRIQHSLLPSEKYLKKYIKN